MRSSLVAAALSGRYEIHGDPSSAKCVIALSFGYRRSESGQITPGMANEYLAQFLEANFRDKVIIAQFEIDDALKAGHDFAAEYRIEAPGRNGYLDTHEVAVQAWKIMADNGLGDAAIVLAHSHHLPRADRVLRAVGIETATPGGVHAIWDRESAQSWTTGSVRWAVRELLVIGVYAFRGWLRAKPGSY